MRLQNPAPGDRDGVPDGEMRHFRTATATLVERAYTKLTPRICPAEVACARHLHRHFFRDMFAFRARNVTGRPSLTRHGATIPRPDREFDPLAGHGLRTGRPAGEFGRRAAGGASGPRSKVTLARFRLDPPPRPVRCCSACGCCYFCCSASRANRSARNRSRFS
jgi:hypothetical protein